MNLPTFELEYFLEGISGAAVLLVIVLGVALGLVVTATEDRLSASHLLWLVAGGAIYFIPLAILRSYEGRSLWERVLSSFALWCLYSVVTYVTHRLTTRSRHH